MMVALGACSASAGPIGANDASDPAGAVEDSSDAVAGELATPAPDNSDVIDIVGDTFEGPVATGTTEPYRNGTPCQRPWQRGAIGASVLEVPANTSAAGVVQSVEAALSVAATVVVETQHYGMGYAEFDDLRIWFEVDNGAVSDVPISGVELVGTNVAFDDLATIAAKYLDRTWDEIDASQQPKRTNSGPIMQNFFDIDGTVSFVTFPAGNRAATSVCLVGR